MKEQFYYRTKCFLGVKSWLKADYRNRTYASVIFWFVEVERSQKSRVQKTWTFERQSLLTRGDQGEKVGKPAHSAGSP